MPSTCSVLNGSIHLGGTYNCKRFFFFSKCRSSHFIFCDSQVSLIKLFLICCGCSGQFVFVSGKPFQGGRILPKQYTFRLLKNSRSVENSPTALVCAYLRKKCALSQGCFLWTRKFLMLVLWTNYVSRSQLLLIKMLNLSHAQFH